MNKTVLITGWKGIVGSALSNLYSQSGFNVVCFDDNVNIKASTLLHLAAKFSDNVDDVIDSNICYMKKIIDYAIKNDIKEFVFFSAMRAYGQQNKEDVTEDEPTIKPCLYGLSKLFGEKMLENSGISSIALRLPGVLTRNSCTDFLSRCLIKLLKDEDVVVVNADRVFNNFILVDSIFEFLKNLKLKKRFDIVNLGSNKEISLLQIIAYLKSYYNSKSKITISNKKQNIFNISIEKAKNEYAFNPLGSEETLSRWCRLRSI